MHEGNWLRASSGMFVDGDHTIEAGMKALGALAAMPDRPSAVLCSNDMTAIGVMRAAFDLRLNIPQGLSVVGFDDIRLAQFMAPPLTTVQMSQTEIPSCHFQRYSILWNRPAMEMGGRCIQ